MAKTETPLSGLAPSRRAAGPAVADRLSHDPVEPAREPGIRPATLDDLDALVGLEQACFEGDRISRRQFRYLLTRGHARTLVAPDPAGSSLIGYVMVLFSRGTSLARLYSIAVSGGARGLGLGRRLVAAAEAAAIENACADLRLEVRRDNAASLALFRGMGYRDFGTIEDYYEDHMEALRLQKSLAPGPDPALVRAPFYAQTLDFTCGSAALMMAMRAVDPGVKLDRKLELRVWREATTIFMTSGHGGCGPYGLALAAAHRGFEVELLVRDTGVAFFDSVRSADKKRVMQLVQEDMVKELERLQVPIVHGPVNVGALEDRFHAGRVPVVLISSVRIYAERFPHWVTVTGFDERFIYVHDPLVDVEEGERAVDSINMPILRRDFERMARYGRAGLQAAVIVGPRDLKEPGTDV
ncbi:GNAT family acetyltransferase [Thioalkalivibrio nitratireducens DSM 14787]|uniref:GNAT family acetyltransferase n=1 Tax=Thioalkalivibrio nitratireducens (strain DSM 14787 / UNIQEM 213 / ALEN2) TaxID=1255043 RepID=L0DT18_THIND|nr:GNAT family N-acetyltransferase/peptidase C39 family protein [Thioalkalivibrio nitratireducens]AGA32153.1 GNAT family acetyltransferase [Thioalkalivibrio nitratireducens DSM 14787]